MTIFLDMDGVFNICMGTKLTYMNTGEYFEKHLVEIFDTFLDQYPDINIVISSSWRDDMNDLKIQIEKAGFRHWDRVVGKIEGEEEYEGYESFRGHLIYEYIKHHKIDDYIIIDDFTDPIFMCEEIDRSRVIRTSPFTGIAPADILNIKNLL